MIPSPVNASLVPSGERAGSEQQRALPMGSRPPPAPLGLISWIRQNLGGALTADVMKTMSPGRPVRVDVTGSPRTAAGCPLAGGECDSPAAPATPAAMTAIATPAAMTALSGLTRGRRRRSRRSRYPAAPCTAGAAADGH